MSVELVDTATGEVVGNMMSADEARQGFAELRTGAEGLVPIYMRLLEGKAWLSLGYGSMQDAVDAEVGQGFRLAVTRAERRQVVAASLLAEPEASNAEHARRTGSSDKTVAVVREEMVAGSEIPNLPTRTNPQGRSQPATRKPTRADHLAEFPALDVPEATDADIAHVAAALRTVQPRDLPRRTEIAVKWLRSRNQPTSDEPDPARPAFDLMDDLGRLAVRLRRTSAADVLAAAWPHADPLTRETWTGVLADLTEQFNAMRPDAPTLRRIK